MANRIIIIQGHPDPSDHRFCRALARAYAQGAEEAGCEVKVLDVARVEFPMMRTREEWEGSVTPEIQEAQGAIARADRLVLFYPLWLGSMPALLKGFLEQVFRPGFAISKAAGGFGWKKLLKGKSATIVVTMGMPAFIYRWWFRAHSLKSLEKNILAFCGISPIEEHLVGSVESLDAAKREKWLERMRTLGRKNR